MQRRGKKDQEYFRLALTLRQEVGDEPDIQSILPAVLRSLRHVEAEGLLKSILRWSAPGGRIAAGLTLTRPGVRWNPCQTR